MDSVHHIWCPLSSQEYQDLPDGAETTLTKRWMLLLKIDEWPPAMRIDCCVWGCGGLPLRCPWPSPFILSFKHPIPHPPSELHQMKTSLNNSPYPLFLPKNSENKFPYKTCTWKINKKEVVQRGYFQSVYTWGHGKRCKSSRGLKEIN